MAKLNYLNVGCGSRFHKEWTNIDMNSSSQHVKPGDIIRVVVPYFFTISRKDTCNSIF